MDNNTLIHKILNRNADESELRQWHELLKNEEFSKEAFSFMLLESGLSVHYGAEFKFRTSKTPALFMRRRFFLAGAAILLVGLGIVLIAKIFFAQPPAAINRSINMVPPPAPPWQLSVTAETIPPAVPMPFRAAPYNPPASNGLGKQGGNSEGGNAEGETKNPDAGLLEQAIRIFSGQFKFTVRLPKNLPNGFSFLTAKRFPPSQNPDKTETALLVYINGSKQLLIFEDTDTKKTRTKSKNASDEKYWHQSVSGELRITFVGAGFSDAEWRLLIKQTIF
ncbi:MAG: hypothetical protein HZA48_02845 [Planctomycetes bacterium]|nr:hypothetical protein [Planctomycetota bacterium]